MAKINKIKITLDGLEYEIEDSKAQEKLKELESILSGSSSADVAPVGSSLNFSTTEDSVVLEGSTIGGGGDTSSYPRGYY